MKMEVDCTVQQAISTARGGLREGRSEQCGSAQHKRG
jgi:hypothetical protein